MKRRWGRGWTPPRRWRPMMIRLLRPDPPPEPWPEHVLDPRSCPDCGQETEQLDNGCFECFRCGLVF